MVWSCGQYSITFVILQDLTPYFFSIFFFEKTLGTWAYQTSYEKLEKITEVLN